MHTTLLCLHGWGGSKESFMELRAALKDANNLTILTPDLPGFGCEPEPPEPWTVDDYAEWVEQWLNHQPLTINHQLHILGHSHGGRIALKMAVRGNVPIAHLYLCAAAGIRHPRHFKRIIGLMLAKTGKFFLSIPGLKQLQPIGKTLLYKLVRVHDYEKASPIMRDTLIRVSEEDLRPLLPYVKIPTDIFWGKDDGMTPVSDAFLMHKKIAGSQLHTYDGVRHRVHRDKAQEIGRIIKENKKKGGPAATGGEGEDPVAKATNR